MQSVSTKEPKTRTPHDDHSVHRKYHAPHNGAGVAVLDAPHDVTLEASPRIKEIRPLPLGEPLVDPEGNFNFLYQAAKRALDIAGALTGLILLAPIMLTTLVVLSITTRGKPLFFQQRLGYRGLPFTLCKFRTMRPNSEKLQAKIKNEQDGPIFKNRRDPRITRIGYLLRKLSIDEMPQLFNVLFGQMSLVGPRPPVAKEVAQYTPYELRRLSVKPGLTCLWQVSGRSEVGFDDWMRMDIWYVEHQSLSVDLWLLVKTPLTVLSCRGAY